MMSICLLRWFAPVRVPTLVRNVTFADLRNELRETMLLTKRHRSRSENEQHDNLSRIGVAVSNLIKI